MEKTIKKEEREEGKELQEYMKEFTDKKKYVLAGLLLGEGYTKVGR